MGAAPASAPSTGSLAATLRHGPLALREALTIAAAVGRALERMHASGRIHGHVAPANITWDRGDGRVELAEPSAGPLLIDGGVEGQALAYVSPEQTGRMQRSLDQRSDLYSLGVVLYHALTGEPPFRADDPMAMIHCHLAVVPVPPAVSRPELPPVVSALVLRLLAKNAEERYQTAFGAAADLERCLRELGEGTTLGDFELGGADQPTQLRIPSKLYGREREVRLLEDVLARASEGRAEIVLVSGSSGVGKSSLVRRIQRLTSERGGFFAEGKFDQLKRDVPYAALRQALQGLVRDLLRRSDEELAAWRRRIEAVVERSGQLLIDLVPELAKVIGPQPPVERLLPVEAQVQFHHLFERFLALFARQDQPLTLFLDDLQWVDRPTLEFLQALFSRADHRGLLLIGAYRDGEIDANHPLTGAIASIEAIVPVHRIELAPLREHDVLELLCDTLRATPAEANELAALIWTRSEGNPFFVAQLLHALHQQRLLSYAPAAGRWQWDLSGIDRAAIVANVVDLMLERLRRLPERTQRALRLGACVGASFTPRLLAMVVETDEAGLADDLAPAIDAGLLIAGAGHLHFLHDRVQQTAYALTSAADRPALHLAIGRLLLRSLDPAERYERVFELVWQLDQARHLITEPGERLELAEINLVAAERARDSVAFGTFLDLAGIAAELLTADAWQTTAALAQRVQLDLAEAAYQTGDHERVARELAPVIAHAPSRLVSIQAHRLLMLAAMGLGRPQEAATITLDFLATLGIRVPLAPRPVQIIREFLACKLRLSLYSTERVRRMPSTEDPEMLATMEFAMLALPPVSYAAPTAFPVLLMKLLRLTLDRGHCFLSPVPFLGFAIVLGRVGRHAESRRYHDLAFELQRRFGSKKVNVYIEGGAALFLRSRWQRFVEIADQLAGPSYSEAAEIGGHEIMGHALMNALAMHFLGGRALPELKARGEAVIATLERIQQWTTLDTVRAIVQTIDNLVVETPGTTPLDGTTFRPEEVVPRMYADGNLIGVFCTATFAAYWDLLFGDGAVAVEETERAEQLCNDLPLPFLQPTFVFVQTLALLRIARRSRTGAHRKKIRKKLAALRSLARVSPQNLSHMPLLVAAERASSAGNAERASAGYEAATRLALDNGMIHDAALARELCGEHHLRAGRAAQAREQLLLASRHYQDWGARAKVAQLAVRHAALLPAAEATVEMPAIAPRRALDLASVWRASRALSGELVIKSLLRQLMDVMIENAGADAGSLLLDSEGDGWKLEARLQTNGADGRAIDVLQGVALADATALPRSLIHYVIRSGDSVVLDDAATDGVFADDPHLAGGAVHSLLCIPIRSKNAVTGVLYLENHLTRGAFTADRVEFLTILSGQAAVSIENALLYASLERKVEERTEKLRSLQEEAVANAHFAGMAEIAAEVLHNVGNVLNSVNVSCDILRSRTRGSKVEGLVKTGRILHQHEGDLGAFFADDPRGKVLPRYLIKLSETLQRENDETMRELDELKDKIALIHNVIAAQQSYAVGNVLVEDADLIKVVEDVLRLQAPSLTKAGVRIVTHYTPLAPVPVQRTKLVHVLVNLLKNAEDAVAGNAPEDRVVTIEIAAAEAGGASMTVRDNGCGMSDETLGNAFAHGYTTKKGGHGFGLHSCANATASMGARISAHSAGAGQGSELRLVFPGR